MKACAILAAMVTVGVAMTVANPVPPAADRVGDHWEYGEVTFHPIRVGVRVVAPAGVPAPPPAAVGGGRAAWVTGDAEVEAESWEALATKLKVTEGPKSDNPATYKLRVLNHLGRQGWEMVSATQPTSPTATTVSTFVFKRKAK
ncbi:MAG: hypothetical protein U0746_21340 [Gemmataceae bacterium]